MRTLLVLGGAGQLGSEFGRLDLDGSWRIVPLSRADFDATSSANLQSILSAHAPDVVVNCVAATHVDWCEDHADDAHLLNAGFARTAARAAYALGAGFIQVSTDYVFGGGTHRTPIPADAPPAPVNVYGSSKALGETWAQEAHPDCKVVRVSALFGVAGASGKGGNFIETMLKLAHSRPELRVVDDQVTAPTHARDAAAAIVALAGHGVPGVYHAVSGGAASWCDLAREALLIAGLATPVVGIPTADYPTPAQRPAYSVLDNAGLASAGAVMPQWRDAVAGYMAARPAPAA